MPPDSDNQPPPLIWIAPSNDFPAGAWSEQRMTDNDVPYVPRTEVNAVWDFVMAVAAGCFDYGGGYRSDDEKLEIFHHGIQTVNQALTSARAKGLDDTQVAALYAMGRAARESEKHDGC